MKLSKAILFTLFTLFTLSTFTASSQKVENIIIITTDGLRWQEVFGGIDSAIANNSKFNQGDSSLIFTKYWHKNIEERRKKLMPFFWSTIQQKGQLYGNRTLNNKVTVANPYWFSYPGYSEIFTGYVDTLINSNEYKPNPNITLLEFLNKQPTYKNKVAAFGAWNAFTRILNEDRSKVPVTNAFDPTDINSKNSIILNDLLKDSYKPFGEEECLDVFTHYMAMDYLKTKQPKVLYISYGETDEWGHHSQYRDYLNAANQVDKWIGDIWNYIQSTPKYKNKTALFVTTDHGRGDVIKKEWTSHNNKVIGSNEIWFAVICPTILPKGEVKTATQLYQKQFAQTIASLLGFTFKANHPVAEKIKLNE
jgi:hypothetical protein